MNRRRWQLHRDTFDIGFTFTPPSQTFNNLSAPQTANFAATRQNFVVTNANNHGTGSLREAITQRQRHARHGHDYVQYSGSGSEGHQPVAPLPEITDPVVIDATTQPGYAGTPLIELDGTTPALRMAWSSKRVAAPCKGLAIGRFNLRQSVLSDCNNNIIQGNYIGVDATGTNRAPNNHRNAIVQFVKQCNRRDDAPQRATLFPEMLKASRSSVPATLFRETLSGLMPPEQPRSVIAIWA